MQIQEHVAALRREGELLAKAAEVAAPGDRVPTCPDWTVRELVRHVGRVHRWAGTYVREARSSAMSPDEEEQAWGPMPDDAGLASWFRDGLGTVVQALEQAPQDLECWSFLPAPSPLAFWARRQAHETAIHRADAESACGEVTGHEVDFAVDGVDELLVGFFSRPRNRLRSDATRTLAVTATDADASWLIHIGPDGGRAERGVRQADCELRGPASDLYLGLWNRRSVDDLETAGDVTLLELWREKATVHWA